MIPETGLRSLDRSPDIARRAAPLGEGPKGRLVLDRFFFRAFFDDPLRSSIFDPRSIETVEGVAGPKRIPGGDLFVMRCEG